MKGDGFLDVNELGFALERICPIEETNKIRCAFEQLCENLNLDRIYLFEEEIASYFYNKD